jgi:hypothetical protein
MFRTLDNGIQPRLTNAAYLGASTQRRLWNLGAVDTLDQSL